MNKVLILVLSFIVTILFTACGGEGSSSFTQERESITSSCVSSPSSNDIDSYHTLNSGDSIVEEEANSTVSTYHSLDGTKKVCLDSGKAYIIRK